MGGPEMLRVLIMAATAVTLVSCATPYQEQSFTGGFTVKELRSDVVRVHFGGNGYTTRETVQVYWLNRCAELALEKGFAGFEILSDMQFVMTRPSTHGQMGLASISSGASPRTRIPVSSDEIADVSVWRNRDERASQSAGRIRLAHGGGAVFIYGGGGAPKPGIEGDVHFLAAPVEEAPPKVFNAKALRAQLEPIIKAEKCDFGNVCPHVHEYLLPKGRLR